jgi:glutathione S-transferase kappa 1
LSQTLSSHIVAASTAEVKDRLMSVTKDVVELHGAFGAPWIVVDLPNGRSVSVFGSDRFDHISHLIQSEHHPPSLSSL